MSDLHEIGTDEAVQVEEFDWSKQITMANFLADHLDKNVPTIEFGCGTGLVARKFPDGNYMGVDSCPDSIADAQRRNPGKEFICAHSMMADANLVGRLGDFYPEVVVISSVLSGLSDMDLVDTIRSLGFIVDMECLILFENTSSTNGAVRVLDDYKSIVSPILNTQECACRSLSMPDGEYSVMKFSYR